MGVGGEIAKEGRAFTYQAIDRWGLPTFFALLMFGLTVFLGWLLYAQTKESAIQNTLKLEKIAEIERALNDLKQSNQHLTQMLGDLILGQQTWQTEHREIEAGQLDILRRLDRHGDGGNYDDGRRGENYPRGGNGPRR